MVNDREALEQKLREQAQEVIRKLLDDLPEANEITISDMEKATGHMGQALMQETMQQLVNSQQAIQQAALYCEHCQARLSRRGKRKRHLVTVRGEVKIERDYYVCPQCGTSFFPPR